MKREALHECCEKCKRNLGNPEWTPDTYCDNGDCPCHKPEAQVEGWWVDVLNLQGTDLDYYQITVPVEKLKAFISSLLESQRKEVLQMIEDYVETEREKIERYDRYVLDRLLEVLRKKLMEV